jgi:selenide,water dikinase
MLPGYVVGYYTKEECYIDLNKLCQFGRVRLIHSSAFKLDIINKVFLKLILHLRVYIMKETIFSLKSVVSYRWYIVMMVRYDILSIDIGSTPTTLPNSLRFSTNITPVKPIDNFANRWQIILDSMEKYFLRTSESLHDRLVKIGVVGGGAGGTELAFAIHRKLKSDYKNIEVNLSLITRGKTISPTHRK